ncbi:MAG: hypothetical protein WAW11_03860 [Patescibacteria group bacterium]
MSKQQKIIVLFVAAAIILLAFVCFKSWESCQNKVEGSAPGISEKVYTYKNEDKGININFTDPFTEVDDNTVMFGPYIQATASDEKIQAYKLTIAPNKAAKNILAEYLVSSSTVMMPALFISNGLQVIKYVEKNNCEFRAVEVVGQDYNYVFSSEGCVNDMDTDFAYLEKTISKIKILSIAKQATDKRNIYYRNDQFGFGFSFIPTGWANYVIKKTDNGLDFGFVGKFETKDDVKDFVLATDGTFQKVLSLGIYAKADYEKLGLDESKIKKIGENNFYVFTVSKNLLGEATDGDFLQNRRAEAEAVVMDFSTFNIKAPVVKKATTTPTVKK